MLFHLTMAQKTSSSVEGDQSVVARATKGGWALNATSELHAILDKGAESSRIRQAERDLSSHRLLSSQSTSLDGILKEAVEILQPLAVTDLERSITNALSRQVAFCEATATVGAHWKVRAIGQGRDCDVVRGSVGPSFDRVRVIVLCLHPDGHYFLLCSCGKYQRELRPCICIIALKQFNLNLFEDFSFVWHLSYDNQDEAGRSLLTPTTDIGKLDGPGVRGIDSKHLEMAKLDTPLSRTGVAAWLREGGMQWVPESVPRWRTEVVTEAAWLTELKAVHERTDGILCA
jgi:hypothetical protein